MRLAVLPFVLLAVACGGSRDAADKQIDTLRGEINRLQAEQDRLGSRLTALETSDGRPLVPTPPTPAADADHPSLKVVVLRPGDDEDAELDSPPAIDGQTSEHVSDVGDPRGKAKTKSVAPSKEYAAALALAKKKDFAAAIEAFNGFLVRNPDHPNADNAMFWIGSCQIDAGDVAKGTESLEGLLARFPQSNKTPDALLKLSSAYEKSGRHAESVALLTRLHREFPTSDAAHRAPKG